MIESSSNQMREKVYTSEAHSAYDFVQSTAVTSVQGCKTPHRSFRDEKIRSFIWRNMESGDGREGNRKEEITINEDSNRVGVAAN